jgi:hypothetical protein
VWVALLARNQPASRAVNYRAAAGPRDHRGDRVGRIEEWSRDVSAIPGFISVPVNGSARAGHELLAGAARTLGGSGLPQPVGGNAGAIQAAEEHVSAHQAGITALRERPELGGSNRARVTHMTCGSKAGASPGTHHIEDHGAHGVREGGRSIANERSATHSRQ